jgi:acyl-CoA thioesterase FadM
MEKPTAENIRASIAVVQLAKKLGLSASLYLAQEAVFKAAESQLDFKKIAELSDLLELKTEHLIAINEEVIKKATAGGLLVG